MYTKRHLSTRLWISCCGPWRNVEYVKKKIHIYIYKRPKSGMYMKRHLLKWFWVSFCTRSRGIEYVKFILCVSVYIYTHIHTHTHARTHTHTQIHARMHTQTHAHTYKHTHTHKYRSLRRNRQCVDAYHAKFTDKIHNYISLFQVSFEREGVWMCNIQIFLTKFID